MEAKEQLLKEMKRGKGLPLQRLQASRKTERAENHDRSLYVSKCHCHHAIADIFQTPPWLTNTIALATVAMSLLILAYSLLQDQANDPVKADQFHRCATEINELRRKIRSRENVSAKELEVFSKEYDNILRRYSINHDDIDYERYQLEHPDEFPQLTSNIVKTSEKHVTAAEQLLNGGISAVLGVTVALAAAAPLTSPQFVEWLRSVLARFLH